MSRKAVPAVGGDADVVVADGFTGNIFLKTMEGTAGYITKEIKRLFLKNGRTKARRPDGQGRDRRFPTQI